MGHPKTRRGEGGSPLRFLSSPSPCPPKAPEHPPLCAGRWGRRRGQPGWGHRWAGESSGRVSHLGSGARDAKGTGPALADGPRASPGRVPGASRSPQGLGSWAALGHAGFQQRQNFGACGDGGPVRLGRGLPSSSSHPIGVPKAASRAFPDPSFQAGAGAAPVRFCPAVSARRLGPRGSEGCRGGWSAGVGPGARGPPDPSLRPQSAHL